MKIVIDISLDDYETLKQMSDVGLGHYHEIILSGTPLPKGHGRLIDADELKKCEQRWSCDYEPDGYSHIVEIEDIDNEPTIIEADKENE